MEQRRKLLVGALGLLIMVTGCGPGQENTPPRTESDQQSSTTTPERHSLVLTANGSAQVTSLTYTLDGRVVGSGPASLPWKETISIPEDGRKHSWALEVEYGSGDVTLLATVDDQLLTQSSGAGGGHVSIDGDLTAG